MTLPGDDPALEREKLHAEIARLISLLEAHGIEWRLPLEPSPAPATVPESSRLSSHFGFTDIRSDSCVIGQGWG